MGPAPFIVVVDANVLYPLTLRDTVLRAAAAGFYQLRWSADILEEMERNLVAKGEYLPVAEAGARAAVAPATIRVWMAQGRLGRYHAGRELRGLATELDALMRTPSGQSGPTNRPTPEEEADRYLRRRRKPTGSAI